jgi:hypothetical protein
MKRARVATCVFAAGLGVLSGCNGLGSFRLLPRNRGACCSEGIPMGAPGDLGQPGPMMGDFAPPPMPPSGATSIPVLPAPNPTTAPSNVPVPRLVPQPETAKPMPYTP